MKSPWLLAVLLVTLVGWIAWFTRSSGPAPSAKEKESRRHPAPPTDLQTVNRHIGQSVSDAQLVRLDGPTVTLAALAAGQPLVLVFFSHDCDCSLEFSRYFAAAMQASQAKADWRFVFADTPEQISGFHAKSGFPLPSLRDPGSRLAQSLGVSKSGCFVLIDSAGKISAIWPGVSLSGLEDLFSRLLLPPLSASQLSGIPQSPTAGCPLSP